jgi:hypothetical protein
MRWGYPLLQACEVVVEPAIDAAECTASAYEPPAAGTPSVLSGELIRQWRRRGVFGRTGGTGQPAAPVRVAGRSTADNRLQPGVTRLIGI